MKKFMTDFVLSAVFSLLVIPMVLIGLSIWGTVWGGALKPWLDKKLHKDQK